MQTSTRSSAITEKACIVPRKPHTAKN